MWKIKRGSFETGRRGKRTEKYENFLDERKLRKPIKAPKPREEYPGNEAQTCLKEKGHTKGIYLESKRNYVEKLTQTEGNRKNPRKLTRRNLVLKRISKTK
jgi:hypothetical protein